MEIPKNDKTLITVQVDEGVEVQLVPVPNTTGIPDPTDPNDSSKHPVTKDNPTAAGYKRSYRWNAAGC